jgi:hypothetical protein
VHIYGLKRLEALIHGFIFGYKMGLFLNSMKFLEQTMPMVFPPLCLPILHPLVVRLPIGGIPCLGIPISSFYGSVSLKIRLVASTAM